MHRTKKILFGMLAVFIAIQFIQPAHNNNRQVVSTDISKLYDVPQNLRAVLEMACYDCHSNRTNYPWYTNIQPVGWMLYRHIKQGKATLNFSEFGSYSERRRASKIRSIKSSIQDGSMPLPSYLWMHHDARLSKEDKALIVEWAQKIQDSLVSKN